MRVFVIEGELGLVKGVRSSKSVLYVSVSVNQQIVAAIKFGVSQNKVILRLLNLASPSLCSVRSTYDHVCWRDILAKTRNSPNSPNIIARQNLLIYSKYSVTSIDQASSHLPSGCTTPLF